MPNTNGRGNGLLIGLVTSLEDPDKLGRVQVKYPTHGNEKSDWARLVSPMAGKERGLFLRPDVGDEVLVAFEMGDPRRPCVIGGMWSETDKHPKDDGKAKENNWRFLRSRSGHMILLDDTDGKEKIEIVDKTTKQKITIDASENKITIICSGEIEIKADKALKLTAPDITIEASNTLTLKGSSSVNIN